MKYDADVASAVAHWAPILRVAIDPHLVHAVIERESRHGLWLETAETRGRKSYGPMMVLDSTARDYGVSNPAQLKDPALGIYYGVRYLGEQLRRFPGDVARAVSAYNAGPGNARRNAAGKFPNQEYVDAVVGFWRVYGGAAGVGAAALALAAVGFLLWRGARRRRAA